MLCNRAYFPLFYIFLPPTHGRALMLSLHMAYFCVNYFVRINLHTRVSSPTTTIPSLFHLDLSLRSRTVSCTLSFSTEILHLFAQSLVQILLSRGRAPGNKVTAQKTSPEDLAFKGWSSWRQRDSPEDQPRKLGPEAWPGLGPEPGAAPTQELCGLMKAQAAAATYIYIYIYV